jgi:FkbM family methyltransferase
VSRSLPGIQALSSLSKAAARPVNSVLGRFGYRVNRIVNSGGNTMEGGLMRAAQRGVAINTVIDIGASNGSWSDVARKYFDRARYLLVEANSVHEPALREFKQRVPSADYILAAAGDRLGNLSFDASDPFGGRASVAAEAGSITVPATTIDHEVATRSLPGPFAIKLDTHGFELPILEGAKAALRDTNLLIIEVYNFTLVPGALRFFEMCEYLRPLGFLPIDLCDPMYRPKDGAFWQCDMFFARSESAEFRSNAYE